MRASDCEPVGGDTIEAAGGVLWRQRNDQREFAVIHRPKYDDWTLPKGKLDPGESHEQAAVREVAEELGEDVETVEELLTYARTPTSLETPVGEDGDAELGDFIEDRNADDPMEVAAKGMARRELLDVVAGLPERERIILELRFGLLDGEARTLDDVGRYFGLTRERIRQVEARALSKLRHPSRGRALSDTAA